MQHARVMPASLARLRLRQAVRSLPLGGPTRASLELSAQLLFAHDARVQQCIPAAYDRLAAALHIDCALIAH